MNHKVGGPFDITLFFWNVVKFLEDPDFQEEVATLISWWNQCVATANSLFASPNSFITGVSSQDMLMLPLSLEMRRLWMRWLS
jgi:hypothetical protein